MTGTQSKKILIVDDEPDVVSYLSTLLKEAGYEIVTAANGREGLDLARRSLAFGADDLDGTIGEERIYHMAGADSPVSQTVDALRGAIAEAGLDPVMRDAFYSRVA